MNLLLRGEDLTSGYSVLRPPAADRGKVSISSGYASSIRLATGKFDSQQLLVDMWLSSTLHQIYCCATAAAAAAAATHYRSHSGEPALICDFFSEPFFSPLSL